MQVRPLLLVSTLTLAFCGTAFAQNTYLWNASNAVGGTGGGGTAWIRNGPTANATGNNWVNQTGGTLTVPGVTNNASVTVNGHANDVATFNLSATLNSDIGMSNATGNGSSGNGAANGLLSVGAIANLSTTANLLNLRASSLAPTPPGILQLNGAYSGNTAGLSTSTIVSAVGGDITFTFGSTNFLDVRLGIDGGVISVSSGRTVRFISSINDGGNGRGFVKDGAGTLIINGTNTNTGNNSVLAGTLGGSGTVGGQTTVQTGGTIRGGIGTDTGTLNVSNVTIQSGGALFANLAASGTNSTLAFAGNSLDLKSGSILRLDDVTGFGYGTFNLATFTNGNSLLLDATQTTEGQLLGEYVQGTGASGAIVIDPAAVAGLATGDRLELRRTGNNLVLTFSPVPEPGAILAVCALGAVGVTAVRRMRRKVAVVTLAA